MKRISVTLVNIIDLYLIVSWGKISKLVDYLKIMAKYFFIFSRSDFSYKTEYSSCVINISMNFMQNFMQRGLRQKCMRNCSHNSLLQTNYNYNILFNDTLSK